MVRLIKKYQPIAQNKYHMNNLLIITLVACTLIYGNDDKYNSNWQKRDTNMRFSNEIHEQSRDSVIVPFIWSKIDCRTLDSLAIAGSIYDSLLTVHKDSLEKYLPESVEMTFPNAIVVYARKEVVQIRDCKYEAHFFLLNEGEILKESDCYEFCYIKGIGIVLCTHIDTQLASVEFEKYILADLKNGKGRSILNKKDLKILIDKLNKF